MMLQKLRTFVPFVEMSDHLLYKIISSITSFSSTLDPVATLTSSAMNQGTSIATLSQKRRLPPSICVCEGMEMQIKGRKWHQEKQQIDRRLESVKEILWRKVIKEVECGK